MDSHRDVIERVMTEGMAPGVVILVGRGGKTVLHEAFGRARTNPDVPMRPDAVFDMASVTKAVRTSIRRGRRMARCARAVKKPAIRSASLGWN